MTNLVIIPTYNEKENILQIIDAIKELESCDFDILIVDDGSPDGTADMVKSKMQSTSGLFIEERSGKLGLGTAYIHGFRWALNKGYTHIFEMDADFSHKPSDLPRLREALEHADVSVGSRYTKGGGVHNWPWNRIFLSFGASVYVRLITFMPVKDCTAGFVGYKKEVLEAINMDRIQFIGYAFQIEMKYKAWLKKFNIVEVPIIFADRERGQSKMSSGIVKEGIIGVMRMRLQSLFQRQRFLS